jgi:catechol 2,3-dioxygenase-like lactoylglutathione lyase family enzyme
MTTQMRFEVTTLPVADIDRAKSFYEGLGWRLDADFKIDEHTRAVQLTPPGSPASIHFREDKALAGSAQGLLLIVEDIEAARDELVRGGVDVSDIWHVEPGKGPQKGLDPERRSYFSRASFRDSDGNGWDLQEVTERLPGRGGTTEGAGRAQLLLETALRHGKFEAVAPPHDWWDWYAAYMDAREQGSEPDEAAAAADRYMADVKGIVVPA